MVDSNGGFNSGETRFIGASDTRHRISSSLFLVESGNLVSVGINTRRVVSAVAAETILLSCGYHQSCLIWAVEGRIPSTMSRANAIASLSQCNGWK